MTARSAPDRQSSRPFSALAGTLIRSLRNNPSYVFGRFPLLRAAHSLYRRGVDVASNPTGPAIGDLYRPATSTLEIADSHHVLTNKTFRQHLDDLESQSYSAGISLTSQALSILYAEACTRPLLGSGESVSCGAFSSLSQEQRHKYAIARIQDAASIPIVQAIAADTHLYEAARRFLGYRPRRVTPWLFWSFANSLNDEQRRQSYQTIDYHFDGDGMNFLYASFYLVDTTSDNGAHALIANTHKDKSLRQLLGSARISDDAAVARYGEQRVRIIEGPAGTGFLEDTSCYHKALPPRTGNRLMLQFRYQ